MTTPASPPVATLLDGHTAPRVLLTLVALLLLVILEPSGSTARVIATGAGVLAFSAWVWLPPDLRRRIGQVLGILMVCGSIATSADIGVLMVLGVTALLRSCRPRWGILAVGIVGAAVVLRRRGQLGDLGDLPAVAAESVLVVLVLVLLDAASSATRALRDTQEAAYGAGVDEERVLLGDRLRSLIGRTLLTAQRDLRHAAAANDPADPRAAEQFQALEVLLEDGVAQLDRLLVESAAESLEVELEAAREVCERLGIAVTVSVEEIGQPAVADAAAMVLREAVTNMLKHAEPSRCVIAVRVTPDGTLLAVTNDGANPVQGGRDSGPGTGQRRWRAALAEMGAEVTTTMLEGRRYQVLVRFPPVGVRARH